MNALRGIAVGLVFLVSPMGLHAQTLTGVRDEAGLFQVKTIDKADLQLEEISEAYHLDLLIETIKELPTKLRDQLDRARSNKQAARLFRDWAIEEAKRMRLHGVYILISAVPEYKHVQVTVWPDEAPLPLRWRDRYQLWRCFKEVRDSEGANPALLDMVGELRDCLNKNLSADETTAAPLTWWILAVLCATLGILWVTAEIARKRAKTAGMVTAALETGSTDRLLPGVLGGLLGTLAARPIYDQAIQDRAREATPAPATPPTSPVLELPQEKAKEPTEKELEPAQQNE